METCDACSDDRDETSVGAVGGTIRHAGLQRTQVVSAVENVFLNECCECLAAMNNGITMHKGHLEAQNTAMHWPAYTYTHTQEPMSCCYE